MTNTHHQTMAFLGLSDRRSWGV